MKKWKLFISSFLFTSLLVYSCSTTQEIVEQEEEQIEFTEEVAVEIAAPEPTAEELFLEQISGVNLEFAKVPSKIRKNKSFSSPYEILVTDENANPIADFSITIKAPVKKEGSKLVFEQFEVKTDVNGIAAYTPSNTVFCANTKITAYPAIPSELEITPEQLAAQTIQANYLVESDIALKGAILFVYEYNENGKSPKNSYDILSGLRKKGVSMIGNAPIDNTDYINASKEKIYKENFEYVGTDFGYLIGGTIKYVSPVSKNEDGTYTASLIASMYGIEMKTGNVIYEDIIEYTGSGSNWGKAVENCKEKLTALMVDSVMFGL